MNAQSSTQQICINITFNYAQQCNTNHLLQQCDPANSWLIRVDKPSVYPVN